LISEFQYAWRHYYFYLNTEGIVYLREYLGLPDDVLPNTHKQRAAEQTRMAFSDKGGGRGKLFNGCMVGYLCNTTHSLIATYTLSPSESAEKYQFKILGNVRGDDRGGYRTAETDKQAEAGPGAVPVRQGFGRGAPQPQ
jgi:hypothetical protein